MISAVVLAAGLSRRMGSFKLLLPWNEHTVIQQVVATLEAASVPEIVVVTGHRREAIEDVLAGTSARTVFNPDYAGGEMISSIRAGLRAVGDDVAAVLLCLGDQPQMEIGTVHAVVEAGRGTAYDAIVVPSYQMRAGHPVLVPRTIWPAILSTGETLRTVMAAHRARTCYVPVATPTILADLDTPADYAHARPHKPERPGA